MKYKYEKKMKKNFARVNSTPQVILPLYIRWINAPSYVHNQHGRSSRHTGCQVHPARGIFFRCPRVPIMQRAGEIPAAIIPWQFDHVSFTLRGDVDQCFHLLNQFVQTFSSSLRGDLNVRRTVGWKNEVKEVGEKTTVEVVRKWKVVRKWFESGSKVV